MEKNGGSCAGKWRFHVFVTDSSTWNALMGVSADCGAALLLRKPCGTAAGSR